MLKYLSHSKKGLKRERNQDRIFIVDHENYYLFLIFDGVSSISSSYLFISSFKKFLKSNLNYLNVDGENLGEIFYRTHTEALSDGQYGMSTLSGLFYSKTGRNARVINIGDSRLYIFSNQFLEKITEDDSLSYQPNILTKCLGSPDLLQRDFSPKEVIPDFNFLLCTDGFYNLMGTELKAYFDAYNFKRLGNIEKKLSYLQRKKNKDDSSYILIKHEI